MTTYPDFPATADATHCGGPGKNVDQATGQSTQQKAPGGLSAPCSNAPKVDPKISGRLTQSRWRAPITYSEISSHQLQNALKTCPYRWFCPLSWTTPLLHPVSSQIHHRLGPPCGESVLGWNKGLTCLSPIMTADFGPQPPTMIAVRAPGQPSYLPSPPSVYGSDGDGSSRIFLGLMGGRAQSPVMLSDASHRLEI